MQGHDATTSGWYLHGLIAQSLSLLATKYLARSLLRRFALHWLRALDLVQYAVQRMRGVRHQDMAPDLNIQFAKVLHLNAHHQ